jgi:predicted unusual protein kinase regulating ubiquinone biosynthesis (AarF/ABC1/UbiB family)
VRERENGDSIHQKMRLSLTLLCKIFLVYNALIVTVSAFHAQVVTIPTKVPVLLRQQRYRYQQQHQQQHQHHSRPTTTVVNNNDKRRRSTPPSALFSNNAIQAQVQEHVQEHVQEQVQELTKTQTQTQVSQLFSPQIQVATKWTKVMLLALTSMITKVKNVSMISSIQSSMTSIQSSLSSISSLSRPTILKSTLKILLLLTTLKTILNILQTRKRQKIDETSEWGRYADYPSIRGKALFGLMMQISCLVFCARFVNMLPGGDYSLFRRNKNDDTKIDTDIDNDTDIDIDTDTDTDQDVKDDINNGDLNISDFNNDTSTKSNTHNNSDNNSWSSRKAKQIRQYTGDKLATGLLKLGPLYIKIGQIISCRDKLLPIEWQTSLERLQDRVPAKSGQEALKLAYEAYDNNEETFHSIFSEFDDVPIAAASLGQVHKAKLRVNDAEVAIKLQRSRLRDIYDKDLKLMNKIAVGVDKFAGKVGQVGGVQQSWESIFKDAEMILYREIDYRDEAMNARRFANDFGIGMDGKAVECTAKSLDGKTLPSAASWMRTPFVYDEYSTEKILVMEYVPSIKISEDEKLNAAGLSMDDKEYLAECLARAYLRQFCVNKFFSTDPHPGNLGVEIINNNEKGMGKATPRLVFYDFGQACSLQNDQSGGILDVIEGIVDSNVDNCVDAFVRMGVLVDNADLDKVKRKVQKNFETGLIKVKSKKKRRKNQAKTNPNLNNNDAQQSTIDADLNIGNEKSDSSLSVAPRNSSSSVKTNSNSLVDKDEEPLNDAEIMTFFTLPAEYAFVARAISQMDGVGKGLDADFDFISASAPYLVEIKGGEKYIFDEVKKLVTPVLRWQVNLQKQAGFTPTVKRKESK